VNQYSTETASSFDPSLLLRTTAFPHVVTALKLLETHLSWVVLTGKFAYKIKKPVKLPFVDYSTLEKRKHFCDLELELNRELAPDIYLDVVRITGTTSNPAVNGRGTILEYAVRMNEFDQADILAQRLERKLVTTAEIDRLAELIADFHGRIPRAAETAAFGSAELVWQEAADNFLAFGGALEPQTNNSIEWHPALSKHQRQQLDQLHQWTELEFASCEALMARRHASGMIRRCHGDMHAGNIVLFNRRIEVFDRIEFNADFQWTDCMNELAFPCMDLTHYHRPDLANRLLSLYMERTGDYTGLGVFRFYLVYRSLVRAKVDWIRYQQTHDAASQDQHSTFRSPFIELALRLSQRPNLSLYITHGLSGSGKSTEALKFVQKTGAIRIRSDVERRRLNNHQSPELKYSAEERSQVYAGIADVAESVLTAGFPVVVDATFLKLADRQNFRLLAERVKVPFGIIECAAPVEELRQRIGQRHGDASEATLAVLEMQIETQEILTAEELPCIVSSGDE
jgi:uncharacterized protein